MKKNLCLLALIALVSTDKLFAGGQSIPTQPPLLKKKDKVAIVAPASMLKDPKSVIAKAAELLQSWGLEVVLGKHVGVSNYNAFAKTDEQRAADLQWALDDPTIKAIIALRGGYGTTRIIDQLDFKYFLKNLKWVIGFSDITTLHIQLHKLGIVSAHGPMLKHFSLPQYEASVDSLRKLLFEGTAHLTTLPNALNRLGVATAPVVGGNLTLICSNMETPSALDMKNKILVIEDIGEDLYALDRTMVQLKRAGKLKHLAGLVVGEMTRMQENSYYLMGKSAEEIIQEHVADYGYPVAFQFPIGHEVANYAFPHGSVGTLCVTDDKVSLVFEQ
ncbi:MAG: S66 peptidase family protein [Bacteroidota bacterium]